MSSTSARFASTAGAQNGNEKALQSRVFPLIKPTPTGVELTLRVIPRARKTQTAGTRGDAVVVRLAAPPVDGAANAALVEWIAKGLKVPARSVRIVSGDRSRDKRVAIDGVSAARLEQWLKTGGSK